MQIAYSHENLHRFDIPLLEEMVSFYEGPPPPLPSPCAPPHPQRHTLRLTRLTRSPGGGSGGCASWQASNACAVNVRPVT